jgi:hypothetical protein
MASAVLRAPFLDKILAAFGDLPPGGGAAAERLDCGDPAGRRNRSSELTWPFSACGAVAFCSNLLIRPFV